MSDQADQARWASERVAETARDVVEKANAIASEADELRDRALRLVDTAADDVELASAAVQVADVLDTLDRAMSDLRAVRLG